MIVTPHTKSNKYSTVQYSAVQLIQKNEILISNADGMMLMLMLMLMMIVLYYDSRSISSLMMDDG